MWPCASEWLATWAGPGQGRVQGTGRSRSGRGSPNNCSISVNSPEADCFTEVHTSLTFFSTTSATFCRFSLLFVKMTPGACSTTDGLAGKGHGS